MTNFEIQKYYPNELKFNGIYSKDNLSELNDGAYAINLDEYSDIETHWVALYVRNNECYLFRFFRSRTYSKEIKIFIGNKDIKTNIFGIQAYG